jgi:hypothetical protein
MIKLTQYIPEIKIQPKSSEIRIGQKYYDERIHTKYIIEDEGMMYDTEVIQLGELNRDNVVKYVHFVDKVGFINDIRNNIMKLIKEIKIFPNTKYKIGDHFDHANNKREDSVMVITNIEKGKVYYDTLDGYWNEIGTVNFRDKNEFDKLINNGTWIIIPK